MYQQSARKRFVGPRRQKRVVDVVPSDSIWKDSHLMCITNLYHRQKRMNIKVQHKQAMFIYKKQINFYKNGKRHLRKWLVTKLILIPCPLNLHWYDVHQQTTSVNRSCGASAHTPICSCSATLMRAYATPYAASLGLSRDSLGNLWS